MEAAELLSGRCFSTDVFDIIEASPDRLREIQGIGPQRAERISSAWVDQKMRRRVPAPANVATERRTW